MPNLSTKEVPEALAQALPKRAARNHRSPQGELMALIQRVVEPDALPPGCPNQALDKPTAGLEKRWSKLRQSCPQIRMTPNFAANCLEAWTSFEKSRTHDEPAHWRFVFG